MLTSKQACLLASVSADCSAVAVVINTIVEPGGNLQPPAVVAPSGAPTRASLKERRASTRGRGAPAAAYANDSTKRAARAADGLQFAS